MENKLTYLIFSFTSTGHCLPIAIVHDKQIACEEIAKLKQHNKFNNYEFNVVELPIWESNSDVCCGITSWVYNHRNKTT